MDNWIEYAPACGWPAFARSTELTAALHARLTEEDWQNRWEYLNFVEIQEVWEYLRETSTVVADININEFVDERIVRLATKGAAADAIVGLLAVEFGLRPELPK